MAKRAVVTGAAAGIGLAVSKALAGQGHRVFLIDLDRAAINALVDSMRADGIDAAGHACSVADADGVAAAFEANDARVGGVDILVNCAGITGNFAAESLDVDTWNRIIGVNQTGTFLCAQAAGRRMLASGGGIIVNVASIYGLVAAPNRVAYSASKAAVIMMTKALAVEWAAAGIRVNCVAPGYVDTIGTRALVDAGKIDVAALSRRTPVGRLASPEDIANAIVSLCDDRMSYVTGQVLAVDGGWTAYGYL